MSNEIKPLVSICCLVYNHEQYLRDCFEGFVKQQTTFPFEILVHDDASTDHSADIIREYTEKYPNLFKPIYQKENQYSKGVRISFEYQYPRAQGKYIALCEGDDYWTDPNKLQMQVDFLEAHPEYSMCFHGAKVKYEDSLHTYAEYNSVQNKDYTAEELLDHWIIPTASIIMRKECSFFPIKNSSAILTGDIFICFACLSMGKIRGFDKTMSAYRVHAGSITYNIKSKVNRILKMPENYECLKENFPFIPRHQINKILAVHYWQRASYQSSLQLSIQDRKKALSLAPVVASLMIFKPLVLALISLLSKIFDGEKVRGLVSKIFSKM